MKETFFNDGKVAVLELGGKLLASQVDTFRREMTDWLQSNPNVDKIVLDMSGMEMIDSAGMGLLVSTLKKMIRKEGDVVLAGLSPSLRMLFEVTRLHRVFQIYDTVDAAVNEVG